jgi:hypothetical protein
MQDVPSPADEKHGLSTGVESKATGKTGTVKKWSSLNKDGSTNLNALQIEFDLPIAAFDTPQNANSIIKLSGITAEDRSDAVNWSGAKVELFAGMAKGFPLVDPEQNGVILDGQVLQAFGNWQGEQQTIDIVVMPGATASNNYNVVWKAGQKIEDMIKQVLARTHPSFRVVSKLTKPLVLSRDETGFYYTLTQFAEYCRIVSHSIITDQTYQGVGISIRRDTILIQDGTSKTAPKDIRFVDLIGQPMWQTIGVIQFKTVMRADLHVNDFVKIPKTALKNTPKSMQNFKKDNVNFKGVFQIKSVRHVGNNRQAQADSWVTVFEAIEQPE